MRAVHDKSSSEACLRHEPHDMNEAEPQYPFYFEVKWRYETRSRANPIYNE